MTQATIEPAICWCGDKTDIIKGTDVLYCLGSQFHDPTATGEPDHITKLYVSGPMTGYPECNYPAFDEVSEYLRGRGFEVENPAEAGPEGRKHYVDFLREDIRILLDCDGLAMLPGWKDSKGASLEVAVAEALRMPVMTWAEWYLQGPCPDYPHPTSKTHTHDRKAQR